MCLNLSKYELLYIINAHPLNLFNNHNLQWAMSVKHLGVVVDTKLSWNNHISHVSTKAAKILNFLHHYKNKSRALVIPIILCECGKESPYSDKHFSTGENTKL